MSVPDLQEPLALLEQEDYDAAIATLHDTVRALPAHLGAHVLLAHAYESQERWAEALQSWAEARFLMPNSPIAEAGTQRVLRRLEDHDDASFTFAFPPSLKTSSPSDADPDAAPNDADSPAEGTEDPPDDADSGLAQLRRQAEREARQGGARPGLSDAPPSSDRPSSPDEAPPTPEEQVEQLEDEGDTDDLDHLINELQSARIEPEADADAPPPDVDDEAGRAADDDTEDIVSETLARIHEGQDDYQEAARIYAALAEQEPDRADEFQEKADEMRRKADEAGEDA
ncbi:tetratricopeptide (TPR) repeat protein [Salinibacter ruber]|uniref:CDC27 family protein n=1 Tax=Salinibacter ruber TaxID=146919 RepID=UPI0021680077|nr:CDC27 family protein [Salinibacter ruber]MCS3862075.1 tetratricopeptide (TPR) repeat protein [Salinibacter ruber]